MEISQKGLEHIKHFEGLRLEAYVCPGGELSIGYGHTGKDVIPGMKITKEQAHLLLVEDVQEAVNWVNATVLPKLTQGQFDALVDFVFNLGVGTFKSSTLFRLVNAGLMDRAALEFPKWVQADGKVLEGLVKRREAARKMFVEG